MPCVIRSATESDLGPILEIYNYAVLQTTAIWYDTPADLEDRRQWLRARQDQGMPVLVADLDGECVGYGTFGAFRPHQGFRHTVEHSVYVAPKAQRQGIATMLMEALIVEGQRLGKHVMVACIEAQNAASVALHAKLGFAQSGYLKEVGLKFGQWLDLLVMQKQLGEALQDKPSDCDVDQ